MADIKAIKTPDGTTYDLKDPTKQPIINDLEYDSTDGYSEGLQDEKVLLPATVTKWKTILGIN